MTPEDQTPELLSTEIEAQQPRRYSVVVNMVFGFLSWILPGLATFFSTPIVVKNLGAADFGLYALVFGFINYSISFSIGKGVTKYVAEYKPAGDYKKINDVISATIVLCLAIGVVAAIFLIGGAGWLVRDVMQIAPENQAKTITSFYLGAGVIFFYMVSQVFSSVLTGLHRFDIYSYVTTFYGVFLAAGNIVLAVLGFNIVELFLWSLAINIVVCVIYFICAKWLMPEMRITGWFQRETFNLVLKYCGGVIFGQIFANLLLLFERGLITRELGSEQLAYYAVPMTLGIYVHMFAASFVMVLFPKASELGSQTDKQIVLYERITKMVVTAVGLIAVTLISSSHLFLANWVGKDFADNAWSILILQTLIFSLMAIGGISWQLLDGLGHTNYNALLTLIWLVVGACLMLAFLPYWGTFGVGLARLFAVLTIPLSILYVEHWLLGGVRGAFWVKLLLTLAAAMAIAALAETLIFRMLPESWLSFLAGGAAGTIVYCVVLLFTGWVTPYEKELFARIFTRTRTA